MSFANKLWSDKITRRAPDNLGGYNPEALGIKVSGPDGNPQLLRDVLSQLEIQAQPGEAVIDITSPEMAREILAGAEDLGDIAANPWTLETLDGEPTGYMH